MLFDITNCSVDVCFGAPTHNEWRTFKLEDPVGMKEYPTIFPNVKEPWL